MRDGSDTDAPKIVKHSLDPLGLHARRSLNMDKERAVIQLPDGWWLLAHFDVHSICTVP